MLVIGILLLTVPLLSGHRLLLFSSLVFFGYCYRSFLGKRVKVDVIDLLQFLFVIIGLLSFFWATNPSLVWHQGFLWLLFVLWGNLLKNSLVSSKLENINEWATNYFILTSIGILFILITRDLAVGKSWNIYFGYNENYISVFLLSLSSFYFLKEVDNIFGKIIKVLAYIFLGYVVYRSHSRGAIIIYLSLSLCLSFFKILAKYRKLLGLGWTMLFFFCALFKREALFQTFSDDDRFFLLKKSLGVFTENIVLGVGLGNWHLEVYNTVRDSNFDNVYSFYRVGSHNLYAELFSELGFLGGLFFVIPFFVILIYKSSNILKSNILSKAAFIIILIYLVSSLFFRDANSYFGHFSGIQLLAFSSLGILSCNSKLYSVTSIKIGWLASCLSFFVFCWCFYQGYTSVIYTRGLENHIEKENEISLLKSIYNPIYKTTHRISSGHDESILFKLAQLYQEKKEVEEANQYYLKALSLAPYDVNVLLQYSRFLLRDKGNSTEAKKYLLKLNSIQPSHFNTNLLLAEICINEGRFDDAKAYLSKIKIIYYAKTYHYVTRLRFLELKMYCDGYLDNKFEMKEERRDSMLSVINRICTGIQTSQLSIQILEEKDRKEGELDQKVKQIYYSIEGPIISLLSEKQAIQFIGSRIASENELINRLSTFGWSGISLSQSEEKALWNVIKNNQILSVYLNKITESTKLNQKEREYYSGRKANRDKKYYRDVREVLGKKKYEKYILYRLNLTFPSRFKGLVSELKINENTLLKLKKEIISYMLYDHYCDYIKEADNQNDSLEILEKEHFNSLIEILSPSQLSLFEEKFIPLYK